jgi:hypothetical protein
MMLPCECVECVNGCSRVVSVPDGSVRDDDEDELLCDECEAGSHAE